MLNRHFQMQLFCYSFKYYIMTEVVAQDDTVTFEYQSTESTDGNDVL